MNSAPAATTRAAPRVATHVRRDRILRAVAAADPALLAIVAPAGWGKSSLLDDWADTRAGVVVRLMLSPRQADAEAFLEELAEACARATAEGAASWVDRVCADGRPAATRLRTLIRRLPADCALALDDVHALGDSGETVALLDVLAELARSTPLRMALASRTQPACVRPRDRVHGAALRIDAHTLAMDAAETAAFFAGTPIEGDTARLADAIARTQGWPAGLRILRHRVLREADGDTTPDDADAALGAYFEAEILEPLRAEVRSALEDAALLDRIDAEACAVIDAGSALPHIDAMAADGLFIARRDEAFQLHPMLRQHLLRRGREARPGRVAECLIRLAADHARNGRHGQAIDAALDALAAAADADEEVFRTTGAAAAECLEAVAPETIRSARRDHVLALAAALPAEALGHRPYLRRLLRWMRRELDDVAEVTTDPAAVCMDHVLDASRALRDGRYADLSAAAMVARASLPAHDAFLRNVVVSVLQAAFRFGGDPAVGEAAVEEAARLADDVRRPADAVQAGAMLGILLIMHGRLHEAEDALRRALAIAGARLDAAAPVRGLAHQFLGYVLYEWDRLDEAALELERARVIAEPVEHRGILTGVLRVLAVVRSRQGQGSAAEEAMAALAVLMERPDTQARNREWLDGTRAALDVACGRSEGLPGWLARQRYEPAVIAALPHPALHARLQEYSTLARALVLLGRTDEAADLATVLEQAAATAGRRGFAVIAAATLAAAREAQGRRADADDALARALGTAAPEHMVRSVADAPAPLRSVLARARPNGVPLGFLEAVRRCAGTAASPAGLTDRERDVLVLLAGGRSNKTLARELGLSVSTVKTHLHNAFRKLGARSRTHALARARELGVFGASATPQ